MTDWQLTIDCNDPTRLVRFWAPLLGYEVQPPPDGFATWNDWYRSVGVPDDELDTTGDGSDRIFDPSGRGPKIWFQLVPERKTIKNRLHLDLFVSGGRSESLEQRRPIVDAKVAEVVALGARVVRMTDDAASDSYAALVHDPEGNEFCIA